MPGSISRAARATILLLASDNGVFLAERGQAHDMIDEGTRRLHRVGGQARPRAPTASASAMTRSAAIAISGLKFRAVAT